VLLEDVFSDTIVLLPLSEGDTIFSLVADMPSLFFDSFEIISPKSTLFDKHESGIPLMF
jgi:hypothetical protein